MLDMYKGKVVNLRTFSDGSHFKNSVVNDFYVFNDHTDGVWLITHHFIVNTDRTYVDMVLPKTTVGFDIIGEVADFRKPYKRYLYGDWSTMNRILALEHAAREEYDINLDLDTAHHGILEGEEMVVYSHGAPVNVSLNKLEDLVVVETVE